MGLELLGIDFGRAACASGSRNFFGEGWPHHRWLGPLGPRFAGSTFVAKTTTLEPRAGNMPLDDRLRPKELMPDCIRVDFRRAAVLNAVGLSGPGLEALLGDGRWQSRLQPFWLSFMAVDKNVAGRLDEVRDAARMVAARRHEFQTRFGVQLNLSCPNVGADLGKLVNEGCRALQRLRDALPGVPLAPKVNATVPVETAREIARHPHCDALVVSNTIPWGQYSEQVRWEGLFGEVSPLARYGGGGLSGAPIRGAVKAWVQQAICDNFPVPVVACGGVMSAEHALDYRVLGAKAVEFGSVAIVRPWRVAGIIKALNGSGHLEW